MKDFKRNWITIHYHYLLLVSYTIERIYKHQKNIVYVLTYHLSERPLNQFVRVRIVYHTIHQDKHIRVGKHGHVKKIFLKPSKFLMNDNLISNQTFAENPTSIIELLLKYWYHNLLYIFYVNESPKKIKWEKKCATPILLLIIFRPNYVIVVINTTTTEYFTNTSMTLYSRR